ncbi:MAG TPA: beta-ketoacyl-ACP synthase III [Myxococcaceae bacterium]|nr:beta-ketoacyl-ACP synthase III [Myxococcaceae bacterium]
MPMTQILGTGAYAPEKVLTNRDLEKVVDTTDQWITERTGIKERRIAAEGEATSDMAFKASVRALEMASTRGEELDMIVVGTITPDMPMPATAVYLQRMLGANKAFAFDVSAACAGSLFAMAIADQFVRTGAARRVLVVGAEMLSRVTNWKDRNTCVLFGDGAGAMMLGPSAEEKRGIVSTHLHTDGNTAELLLIKGGGTRFPLDAQRLEQNWNKIEMGGREVYKFAVRALADAMLEALEANGLRAQDVNHVIAHQANVRILDAVLERLGIPRSKVWLNLDKYGNTSSASLPMTLDEANRAGKLHKGDTIAMMAIGAGMAWGSAVVRW